MVLGANLLLSSDDVKSCERLIQNCKILVANFEIPYETVLAGLKLAKTHNGNYPIVFLLSQAVGERDLVQS